jgi:hypothetical protein
MRSMDEAVLLELDAPKQDERQQKNIKKRENISPSPSNLRFILSLSNCSSQHWHSQSGDQGPRFLESYQLLLIYASPRCLLSMDHSSEMDADDLQ